MKIDPKYVNGEPVCDEENCTAATEGDCDWPLDMLMDSDKKPCIPALRRDRDQAIKERDEARRTVCKKDAYPKNVWLARSLRRG